MHVGFTGAEIAAFDRVVEKAMHGVAVVLVILRRVDAALRGDGVCASGRIMEHEVVNFVTEFRERGRTIFGETAVRTKKNLKLIVQMEKPVGGVIPGLERLPLNASSEDIMGINVRKVVLPVAAGRNLAVLAEAAVRNYVLQLRGIDSTQEFIQRQEKQLSRRG